MGSQQLQSILQALQAVTENGRVHHGLVRRSGEKARTQELDRQSVCSRWRTKYFYGIS